MADDSAVAYLPCLDCRSPTLLAILGHHGGRCSPCDDAYRRSGPCGSGESFRTLTHDDKLAILQRLRKTTRSMALGNAEAPRSWARRIIERHEAGEPIPHASLRMARDALGPLRAPLNVDEGWE